MSHYNLLIFVNHETNYGVGYIPEKGIFIVLEDGTTHQELKNYIKKDRNFFDVCCYFPSEKVPINGISRDAMFSQTFLEQTE